MTTSPGEGLLAVLYRSRALGLLGPGPVERHVEHAEALGDVSGRPTGTALDLGSGGGVPGLVLALRWPGTAWVLLDAAERRVAFLEDALRHLGLTDRVRAVCARAEEVTVRGLVARESVELVVARGFGPPAVTAECAAPLLALSGRLVVSEPPAPEAGRWPPEPLRELGFVARAAAAAGLSFAVLDKVAACPPRLPRRAGRAARQPLF
ncbi:MAG: hypothetical protein GEV08_20950 [Acidimicrobiia bacterium]|nr:hypothetical protein [Acidimicrobiia bacterium]